jgi:hypothetical protein
VLWRVLLVVLGLFGGVGVLIYLIGWLGIQGEGDSVSPIESLLGRGKSAMQPISVVLLSVAAVLSFVFIVQDGFRATLLGAAVVVAIALLIKRNSAGRSATAPSHPATSPPPGAAFPFGHSGPDPTSAFAAASPPAGATSPDPLTASHAPSYPPPFTAQFTAPSAGDYRPPFAPHGPYATRPAPPPPPPPKAPKPKRERSKLGRITFFAVVVVLGVLAMIDVAGARVPVPGYFAAALATIGLGLIVGAWFGRARGLIALAVITAIGLGIAAGVERFGGEVANSNYRPTSLAQVADRYEFTLGNVTLELRGVDFTNAAQDTTIAMKAGQVRVRLPANVDTNATVTMQNGLAMMFGHEYTNADVHSLAVTDLGSDGVGGGTLRLNLQVNNGRVEVAR